MCKQWTLHMHRQSSVDGTLLIEMGRSTALHTTTSTSIHSRSTWNSRRSKKLGEMSFVVYFVTPLILLISIFLWHCSELPTLGISNSSEPEIVIVIGVPSARHHFVERQALRDTWAGYAKSNESLVLKFIVGDGDCGIPPAYRRSQYSCVSSNFSIIGETGAAVFTVETSSYGKLIPVSLPNRIQFRVHYPIIVQKLGLFWNEESPMQATYSVTLWDEFNKVNITQVSFTESSRGHRTGDYLFKPTEHFILPKGFEGAITVTSSDQAVGWIHGPGGPITMATGGNVISYFQDTWNNRVDEELPSHTEQPPRDVVCSMMFLIHESEELIELIDQEEQKTQEWSSEMLRVEKQLDDEMKTHGDIVLVEVVDTYQDIPLKMLMFYKWLSDNVNFRYFIKTDDDCFLNLPLILRDLQNNPLPSTVNVWWGNFRYNWGVDRRGKWAEHDYPSTAYPAFACGSGNLVSADIIHWISRNYRYLHSYQGEDVTMAIWLSAILPTYRDDKRWICDDECYPGMLASAEHTPEEIKQLWSNWVECGDPCECNYEPP